MAKIEKFHVRLNEHESELNRIVDILYFTGNFIRFKILYLIFKKDRTIKEVSELLEMSNAAISQHLQKLRSADLVVGRIERRIIHYSLQPENEKILKSIFREFDRLIDERKEILL